MSDFQRFNAPAGSGKTTKIKGVVRDWAIRHPYDPILCITFTNRAAEELAEVAISPFIEVSTIHSFFSRFAKPLFSMPKIIDFFFELYKDKIQSDIDNLENKNHIAERNRKYSARLGAPLTVELLRASVTSLSYGERQFSRVYSGVLSHDDLLYFVCRCAEKYPEIYARVWKKYKRVIIDEYQDTNLDVLQFFKTALKDSMTGLHLYGDPMQQIYRSDLKRFDKLIADFEQQPIKVTNYRSRPEIVSVLNNIYSDSDFQQEAGRKKDKCSSVPKVNFFTDAKKAQDFYRDHQGLVLLLRNSAVFEKAGALDLYKILNNIPEYGYLSDTPAAGVLLTKEVEEVKSPVIRALYSLLYLEEQFNQGHIGKVISFLKKHNRTFRGFSIRSHHDKTKVRDKLQELFRITRNKQTTIRNVIENLSCSDESDPDLAEYLNQESYADLMDISIDQVRNIYKYRKFPTASTQHGVKGEGHDEVIFVVDSDANLNVRMDDLFKIWATNSLSLATLESEYIRIATVFSQADTQLKSELGCDFNDIASMRANDFNSIEDKFTLKVENIKNSLASSMLFRELYKDDCDQYLSKPGITNAKKLFKISHIIGLLTAYKLFYVGCSRAKEKLDIVFIEKEPLDYRQLLQDRFRQLGFEIVEHSDETANHCQE